MKLIPLKDIDDNEIFWLGTRFRIYSIGLNVKDKSEDYYEYMLAEIPSEREHMLLINVHGHKSGLSLALVKTLNDKSKFVVNGQAIKFSMGIENVFLVSKPEFSGKANNFNNSFNEDFCMHLEMHLCRSFENSSRADLNGFWCDGVSWAPFYNDNVNKDYLSVANILKEKKIVTTANIGISGQDYYEMTIRLGQRALNNYEHGLSLIDCLPGEQSMEWISLDVENRKIEVRII